MAEAEEAALHTERGMVAASASTERAVCGRPMRPPNRIMLEWGPWLADHSTIAGNRCVVGLRIEMSLERARFFP